MLNIYANTRNNAQDVSYNTVTPQHCPTTLKGIMINMIPSNASGKEETCHHHLQVLNVTIHVYPDLQLMQPKFLPMKF